MPQPLNPQQIEAFLTSPCLAMPVITWGQWIGEVIKSVVREDTYFDGSRPLGSSHAYIELARSLAESFPEQGINIIDDGEGSCTVENWPLTLKVFNQVVDYLTRQ